MLGQALASSRDLNKAQAAGGSGPALVEAWPQGCGGEGVGGAGGAVRAVSWELHLDSGRCGAWSSEGHGLQGRAFGQAYSTSSSAFSVPTPAK